MLGLKLTLGAVEVENTVICYELCLLVLDKRVFLLSGLIEQFIWLTAVAQNW